MPRRDSPWDVSASFDIEGSLTQPEQVPTTLSSPRLIDLLEQYFMLERNHDLQARLERVILNEMVSLGYFNGIPIGLLTRPEIQYHVNTRFDMANLAQRFALLYLVNNNVVIRDAVNIVSEMHLQTEIQRNLPQHAYSRSDFEFLSAETSTPPPLNYSTFDNDLNVIDRAETQAAQHDEIIDFIINGQKVKLSLLVSVNRDSRARYLSTMDLRISSLRNTNARHVWQFVSSASILWFRRLRFTRAQHGFKFVRMFGARELLLVKEIR